MNTDKIFEILRRFLFVMESFGDSAPTDEEVLMAVEMLASIERRALRDCGASKEDVLKMRTAASDVAGRVYEESGLGARTRARSINWDAAGAMASDAIKKAMSN